MDQTFIINIKFLSDYLEMAVQPSGTEKPLVTVLFHHFYLDEFQLEWSLQGTRRRRSLQAEPGQEKAK